MEERPKEGEPSNDDYDPTYEDYEYVDYYEGEYEEDEYYGEDTWEDEYY